MKTKFWPGACALVLAVCPLGADDKGKDARGGKFDAGKLAGKWTMVSGEKNGQKVAEDNLKKQSVTIEKDVLTLKGDDATFVMKFKIDAARSPATIKFEMTESPFGAGATASGIIELDGDTLKLCYAPMGEEAPKKFETKEGGMAHLFVMKRAK